jgi:hypothetical protein
MSSTLINITMARLSEMPLRALPKTYHWAPQKTRSLAGKAVELCALRQGHRFGASLRGLRSFGSPADNFDTPPFRSHVASGSWRL